MNNFNYEALDLKGNKIKGVCRQEETKNLYKNLKKKGYFLIKLKCKKYNNSFKNKISIKECSLLSNKLYMLINSGFPITKALSIIALDFKKESIGSSLLSIRNNILDGEGIYESFLKFSYIYPSFFINMLYIGEESGRVSEILYELSQYYEKKYKFKGELKTVLMYPIFVIITFIFMLHFLINKVIPNFMAIFTELGGSIPNNTLKVLKLINYINYSLILILILLLSFYVICKIYNINYKLKYKIDFIRLKIPIGGKLYEKIFIMNFCNIMSIMTKAGVNINKALGIVIETSENSFLKDKIKKCNEFINEGFNINYSLQESGFSNKLFLSMVKIGEESGELEGSFNNVYNIYQKELQDNFKVFIKLIEPTIIIIMAIIITFVFINVFIPMINIMELI